MSEKKRTKIYHMMVVIGNNVAHHEEISERKFNQKMREMKELVEDTAHREEPVRLKKRVTRYDGHTNTVYFFKMPGGHVELRAQICDEGYHFVK